MQSPFPGMDPYLEDPAFWEDFHRSMITYLRDALLDELPSAYDARIDQRVRLVDVDGSYVGTRLPDVSVTDASGVASGLRTSGAVATLEPVTVPLPAVLEERDVWLEILSLPDRALVTAIEILSPSNKTGRGAGDYAQKRMDLVHGRANLVEIDLLLGGERLHFGRPLPPGDYYASVARKAVRPVASVYAWTLQDPLPVIPIPLRPPDADVPLDLATVFRTAFERGRYAGRLQYQSDLPAALTPDRLAWVRDRAAQRSSPR